MLLTGAADMLTPSLFFLFHHILFCDTGTWSAGISIKRWIHSPRLHQSFLLFFLSSEAFEKQNMW